jgi:hypothetical protein
VNTDDRPAIEFSSPQSYQRRLAASEKALVEEELLNLLEDVWAYTSLDRVLYLAPITPEQRAFVSAGMDLVAMSSFAKTDPNRAMECLDSAISKLPPEFGQTAKSMAPTW